MERMNVMTIPCEQCGANTQKVVIPWKHVPICKECRKPVRKS